MQDFLIVLITPARTQLFLFSILPSLAAVFFILIIIISYYNMATISVGVMMGFEAGKVYISQGLELKITNMLSPV